ncbi:hypothetical protein [Levilactobacillus enshiensis]|uniref:hypothetical protein n=1 Tax=Levilactobacillus enshiensis TaxID=2590213 RepID=UPI00117A5E01|nr:hypothetical protein [Levilactobacillus enshiensis]
MKIPSIVTDEQWFHYIRRAEKSDEGVIALVTIMMKTPISANWIWCLRTNGRRYKKNRLIRMIVLYYLNLSPARKKECLEKFFVVPKDTWYGEGVQR